MPEKVSISNSMPFSEFKRKSNFSKTYLDQNWLKKSFLAFNFNKLCFKYLKFAYIDENDPILYKIWAEMA